MPETITQPDAATQDEAVEICVLMNSIFYFLSCVFIMQTGKKYRLVVRSRRKIMYDAVYNTLRGAKIAFAKLFKNKAWYEWVKSEWTFFYLPDKKWLKRKLEGTVSSVDFVTALLPEKVKTLYYQYYTGCIYIKIFPDLKKAALRAIF